MKIVRPLSRLVHRRTLLELLRWPSNATTLLKSQRNVLERINKAQW